MVSYGELQKLVGRRYDNLEALKKDIEEFSECKVLCIDFSQSERIPSGDFMIDYEIITGCVRTLYYLIDNGEKLYITEV